MKKKSNRINSVKRPLFFSIIFILIAFSFTIFSCRSIPAAGAKQKVTPFFYMGQHELYAAFSVPHNREFAETLFKMFFPTADDEYTNQLLSAIKIIYVGANLNAGTKDLEIVLSGAFPVLILNNAIAKQRGWKEETFEGRKYFRHGTGFELYVSSSAIFFASTVKQMLSNMTSAENYPFDASRAPHWVTGKERFTTTKIAFFVPHIFPLLPSNIAGFAAFLGGGTLTQSSAEGTLVQTGENSAELTFDADLRDSRSVQAVLPLVRSALDSTGMRASAQAEMPSHLLIAGTLEPFSLYDMIKRK